MPLKSHRTRWSLAALASLCLVRVLSADAIVTHPFAGVTYVNRTETAPRPLRIHVVQIDLSAPGIRFKLSAPAGPLEVVRQTTLEFLRQERAQLAVNAHFFFPWPSSEAESSLVGFAASEGRVFSAFERPVQSYALVDDAPGLNIDRDNQAAVVHRDPNDSSGTRVLENVMVWTAVAGSAQIVTDGTRTVPVYRDADHPDGLLTPGGPNDYSNDRSWYEALTARTAIGLSRDHRTLTLFTVDARDGSEGMRVGEVADVLIKDYGVWNALNLDGGGSTSMAMEDPTTRTGALVNASSDNPAGRAVGSSLAVFAPVRPR